MNRNLIAVGACASLLLAGCARTHMTSSYGRSTASSFRTQAIPPKKARPEALLGLDSQEAAIIAGSYRSSLGQKAAEPSKRDQVLILSPPGSEARQPLAPSVPGR